MSLIELLISMFMILFGLLSVAALLEVGRHEFGAAGRFDRAMACGRSGLADLKTRGLIDPNRFVGWYDQPPYTNATNYPYWAHQWVDSGGGNWVDNVTPDYAPWVYDLGGGGGGPPPTAGWRRVGRTEGAASFGACVLDPLYIMNNVSLTSPIAQVRTDAAYFPYTPGAPLAMRRVFMDISDSTSVPSTLDPNPLTLDPKVLAALTDRWFGWGDDLSLDMPKDPQQRPVRVFDAAGLAQNEGNYSWMVTVTPTGSDYRYEVSVVVFYQRDFSPPSNPLDGAKPGERWLRVVFDAPTVGIGGGDATLWRRATDPEEWLDVRENDWILLGGYKVVPSQIVYQWYRVISVESAETAVPLSRRVTLAGPDWSPDWAAADFNGDSNYDYQDGSMGIICSGVIGVYSETMDVRR